MKIPHLKTSCFVFTVKLPEVIETPQTTDTFAVPPPVLTS